MINNEYEYKGCTANGFLILLLLVIVIPALLAIILWQCVDYNAAWGLCGIVALLDIICLKGFFVQEPNESRVMIFFGKYRGTCRQQGFLWVNPLLEHRRVSLRIRNMDIAPIKVNDKAGNPVMIGMVLVWRVHDTYKVIFDLDSGTGSVDTSASKAHALNEFVRIQSDAALREVTSRFAYDSNESASEDNITLREGGPEINSILEEKLNDRLHIAGIEVVEARINYLAYAPEIAAVMLRRQQASAVIMAREKIVEGAVSMVEMAIKRLDESGEVTLDEAAKAQMVSSLMVVLCTDEPVTPVLNTQQ